MSDEGLSILLVDDDEDEYVFTRSTLDGIYGQRLRLEWVPSFEPALEALLQRRHDVCLLDHRLGEHTGLDLLRRAAELDCGTPIILLTDVDDRDVGVEALEAGAADFLVKGRFGGPLLERSIRYATGLADERQRNLETLRRREERYSLAIRGANDGLWDWDLVTDRIYLDPRWKAMLGYADDQVGDGPDEWFSRIHPHDAERVRAEVSAHLSGRTPHLQTEHRMRHDDGSYRWVLTRGLAVRDAQGRAIRAAGSQCDITRRKAAEERLLHDALHDTLTGLPNRALFIDRLGRALHWTRRRRDYRFAVLFLDLDGFMVINDRLGHQTGDQLLIALSRRLARCIRQGDTVARLGDDEFVILVDDIDGPDDATQLAERILVELSVPFELDGRDWATTARVGIVLSDPAYEYAEDLLRDADIAMYQAGSRGKASYVTFEPDMQTRALSRLRLEADLRNSMSRQEFLLHYQPVVSLKTGRVAGFEALIRWLHPERGLVRPDDFIPVAEETTLILPLGLWVLREAADRLRRWQSDHRSSPPLSMSINLSCRQFFRHDLAYQIERLLLETGLDARCLRVEIPESVLMERVEPACAALSRLKALGIRLAIDDFGKGYSSLSYLHLFPCDTLKLDRSFIERIGAGGEDAEIVRTITSLARIMGMDVIAEGVETRRQLDVLRDLGCHFAQGYFFSRPGSAEAAESLLISPPHWLEDPAEPPPTGPSEKRAPAR